MKSSSYQHYITFLTCSVRKFQRISENILPITWENIHIRREGAEK